MPLVLTLCTCSWGSWRFWERRVTCLSHVNGGMERLLHLLLQTPRCLSATSAHRLLLPRVPSPWPRSPDVGPSFLPFLPLLPFLMCVLRWMVLVLLCFWLKTHFCVCLIRVTQLSDTSLPCLLIELSIPSYGRHQYTCCYLPMVWRCETSQGQISFLASVWHCLCLLYSSWLLWFTSSFTSVFIPLFSFLTDLFEGHFCLIKTSTNRKLRRLSHQFIWSVLSTDWICVPHPPNSNWDFSEAETWTERPEPTASWLVSVSWFPSRASFFPT